MKDDSEAHDTLFCLGTGKDKNDKNRLKYEPYQFYIKSADEMYKIFKNTPQALENTLKIAEQCSIDIELGKYHLPKFPLKNKNDSPDNFLKQICEAGILERYKNFTPNLKKRLKYELSVIKKMGYAGYFLIVSDYI